MSDQDINLTLDERKTVGKGLNKMRGEGKIPAVIHNHGKDSIHVEGDSMQLQKVYSEAGKSHPVKIKVGNDEFLTLIKDADFHPKKHSLRHLVFNAIRTDVKTEAEVPLVLEGEEIPAEKAGLILVNTLDHVIIEALPKDLIDEIKVDVTGLAEVGDKIQISDLKLPAGVEIKDDPEQTIVAVEMPRSALADEETEGETEESEGEESESAEGSESSESEKTDKSEDE